MARPKAIRVPKTPRSSFNPNRKPSQLVLDQIRHLEWAVLPASQRKPGQLPKKQVQTEAQAAARIEQLTNMVLEANAPAKAGASIAVAPPHVVLPPVSQPAAPRRPTARARPVKKAARGTTSRARGKRSRDA